MNSIVPKSYLKVFCLSLLTLIISCKKDIKTQPKNALLQEWQGPYGGVPAFDTMDVKDIQEAVETGMELNLTEIEAIANSTEPATFENTIAAMERSGAELDRVFSYYGIMSAICPLLNSEKSKRISHQNYLNFLLKSIKTEPFLIGLKQFMKPL